MANCAQVVFRVWGRSLLQARVSSRIALALDLFCLNISRHRPPFFFISADPNTCSHWSRKLLSTSFSCAVSGEAAFPSAAPARLPNRLAEAPPCLTDLRLLMPDTSDRGSRSVLSVDGGHDCPLSSVEFVPCPRSELSADNGQDCPSSRDRTDRCPRTELSEVGGQDCPLTPDFSGIPVSFPSGSPAGQN